MANEPSLARSFALVPGEYPRVNGETFPWFIADEPLRFKVAESGMAVVYLPLLVESVAIETDLGGPDGE